MTIPILGTLATNGIKARFIAVARKIDIMKHQDEGDGSITKNCKAALAGWLSGAILASQTWVAIPNGALDYPTTAQASAGRQDLKNQAM